ncbi:MAG TPA: DNA polymerase III subunit gamma/tau [Acidimicrobiales bacterium]|nr:DNA polymerase III subunit gamma/tau [Acidimicrobiales bacterium]
MADAVPYQSLYRRYRPQRFAEVRGQDHVTGALRNAVREGKVSHGYLFSGPRGTGKTSTARILAHALNCTDLQDGEPCGVCDSCTAAKRGASLDVVELDAASKTGIDDIRDLISSANLGTPGLRKVYIIDEVHMLSKGASAALLKTIEEPPAHVVFVLATTDAQKVAPTIRSRTQHFEFRLLSGDVLAGLVSDISADAGLGVAPEAIDLVVRRGKGSARDALSVLDQVAAAGHVEDDHADADAMVEAICDGDAARVLLAVSDACAAGRDPRVIASDVLEQLRNAFLATMGATVPGLSDDAVDQVADQGRRLGAAGLVRALDAVGEALTEMREALDPRLSLEVALVRVARPDVDASPAALLERIERLERAVSGQAAAPAVAAAREAAAAVPTAVPRAAPGAPAQAPPAQAPADPPGAPPGSGQARAALGAVRARAGRKTAPAAPAIPEAQPTAAPTSTPPEPAAGPGAAPGRDDLTKAWGDTVLTTALYNAARARLRVGRFVSVDDGVAQFALPNEVHRKMSEPYRAEAEGALSAHFGVTVRLKLVVEDAPASTADDVAAAAADEETITADELVDAGDEGVATPEDRLKEAFPGAEEVTTEASP